MKLVSIPVYSYEELSSYVRQKVFDSFAESQVSDQFEAFQQGAKDTLKDKYGIDAQIYYSISYQQGDGLNFNTQDFLTSKVCDLLEDKIPALRSYCRYLYTIGKTISTTHKNRHYEYASANDVDFPDIVLNDFVDDQGITYKQAVDTLIAIEQELPALYLRICSDLEKRAYKCYDVDNSCVFEELDKYYFYADGAIYGEKEE